MSGDLITVVVIGIAVVAAGLVIAGTSLSTQCALFGQRITAPFSEYRQAEMRAESLLRDVLTPAEYAQLNINGYLEVPSGVYPGQVYRIPRDGRSISRLEDGRLSTCYCVGPVENLPSADVVALHKLMLEGAEVDYLAVANIRVRFETRR